MLKKAKYIVSKLQRCFSAHDKKKMQVLIIGILVAAVLEAVVVLMMLPLMYTIMDVETIGTATWAIKVMEIIGCSEVTQFIAVLAFFSAFLYMLRCLVKIAMAKVRSNFLMRWRKNFGVRLLNIVLHSPYQYHAKSSTAVVQRIITSDVDRVQAVLSDFLTLLSEGMTAIIILIMLIVVDWRLTIGAIALISVVAGFINKTIIKRLGVLGRENTQGYTYMVKSVYQAVGSIKPILVNKQQKYFVNQYEKNADNLAKINGEYMFYQVLPSSLVETIIMTVIFAYMGFLAIDSKNIETMLPIFATFAMAAVRILPIANKCTASINGIKYNLHALESVNGLLNAEAKVENVLNDNVLSSAVAQSQLQDGIRVNNIYFKYEDAQEYLFKNVSLEIPTKKSVAFIGTTGSGKTTLADIILGLHSVEKGNIIVDGRDIAEEGEWWSKQIGYIPQFIYLSDDSIRANVAYGIDKDKIDDKQVWKCLREAQMEDFVKSLPDGLDTVTGENGMRLSGGQRQRIGIARALYTNPPFIVLDEATSALDGDTEKAIMDAINNLPGEKTLLIIAHRLSTIEKCNIIYKIENGVNRVC